MQYTIEECKNKNNFGIITRTKEEHTIVMKKFQLKENYHDFNIYKENTYINTKDGSYGYVHGSGQRMNLITVDKIIGIGDDIIEF